MDRVRAVGFDLRGFQPTENRFAELVREVAGGGANALFVEWEECFPWHMDDRLRGDYAYDEQVVQGISALCREHGVSLMPLLGHGGLPRSLLRVPGYSTVAEFDRSEQTIEEHAPAAIRLSINVVKDVYAGEGASDGVVLRMPELSGSGAIERYELRYLTPLIDELRRIVEPVWLLCDRDQATELRRRGGIKRHCMEGALTLLVGSHEGYPADPRYASDRGDLAGLPTTRRGYLGPLTVPIDAELDRAFGALGLSADDADGPLQGDRSATIAASASRAAKLRAAFEYLEAEIATLRSYAERLTELHAAVARDSGRRPAARAWFHRKRDATTPQLAELDRCFGEVRELLSGIVKGEALGDYYAERIAPVREEASVASLRLERLLE